MIINLVLFLLVSGPEKYQTLSAGVCCCVCRAGVGVWFVVNIEQVRQTILSSYGIRVAKPLMTESVSQPYGHVSVTYTIRQSTHVRLGQAQDGQAWTWTVPAGVQ